MSHRHRKSFEERNAVQRETLEKHTFPLLDKNDIALLTMLKSLFSANGQRIVNILINMSNEESKCPVPDQSGILNQLMSIEENNKLKDIFPFLLNLLSNPEFNNLINNPALITSFMSMLGNKKESVSE